MSDIFETTEYIVKGNPDTAETPPSPGGGFDPDSLSASTNTPVDADLIITKESNTWVKKTFAKVWDYIKSKIGINNSQGSANKFLNEKGTFTVVNSGKEYDLEFNNDLDEVTLTEDNVDKTTLPLVAEKVCTRAEYNNMTAEEKARYRIYHFIGEGGTADASDHTVAYTSSDVADSSATSWTSVTPITSGLSLSTLFARVSQMFKNVRYLYKLLGTTDISAIGNGTVTGAVSTLNSMLDGLTKYQDVTGDFYVTSGTTGHFVSRAAYRIGSFVIAQIRVNTNTTGTTASYLKNQGDYNGAIPCACISSYSSGKTATIDAASTYINVYGGTTTSQDWVISVLYMLKLT